MKIMNVPDYVVLEAWPKEQLCAEVRRLREQYERANAAANAWNEKACELEREARRLRDELRDEKEVGATRLGELCGERDRLREENARLRAIAYPVGTPSYSTEAVDALLREYERYLDSDKLVPQQAFGKAVEAVRASRR